MESSLRDVTCRLMVAATVCTLPAPAFSSDALLTDQAVVWGAKNWWRMLARASNGEAIQYGRLIAETTAHLSKSSPDACMRMIMPSVFGPLHSHEWPTPFLERQMSIQRQIVATAVTRPSAVPTEAQAGPILDRVLATLRSKYGAEAVKILTRADKNLPKESACVMWSRLYEEAASLPSDEGGLLVRWLNVP